MGNDRDGCISQTLNSRLHMARDDRAFDLRASATPAEDKQYMEDV